MQNCTDCKMQLLAVLSSSEFTDLGPAGAYKLILLWRDYCITCAYFVLQDIFQTTFPGKTTFCT